MTCGGSAKPRTARWWSMPAALGPAFARCAAARPDVLGVGRRGRGDRVLRRRPAPAACPRSGSRRGTRSSRRASPAGSARASRRWCSCSSPSCSCRDRRRSTSAAPLLIGRRGRDRRHECVSVRPTRAAPSARCRARHDVYAQIGASTVDAAVPVGAAAALRRDARALRRRGCGGDARREHGASRAVPRGGSPSRSPARPRTARCATTIRSRSCAPREHAAASSRSGTSPTSRPSSTRTRPWLPRSWRNVPRVPRADPVALADQLDAACRASPPRPGWAWLKTRPNRARSSTTASRLRSTSSTRSPIGATYDDLAWEHIAQLPIPAPGVVLDLGCGTARWAPRFEDSGVALHRRRRRAADGDCRSARAHPDAEIIEASMDAVDLAPGCADLVITMGSLQYLSAIRPRSPAGWSHGSSPGRSSACSSIRSSGSCWSCVASGRVDEAPRAGIDPEVALAPRRCRRRICAARRGHARGPVPRRWMRGRAHLGAARRPDRTGPGSLERAVRRRSGRDARAGTLLVRAARCRGRGQARVAHRAGADASASVMKRSTAAATRSPRATVSSDDMGRARASASSAVLTASPSSMPCQPERCRAG